MLDAEDRLEGDLGTLRDMGCVIALDDFGAGYSSLAYLARLPVDVLKMDREFVADIARDPRSAALVAGVVELGRTLGMDVVAEGVETAGQLAVLDGMDCRYLQGYLLGGPVRLADLRRRMDEFDPTVLDERPRRRPARKWTQVSTGWDGLVDASALRGAQCPRAPACLHARCLRSVVVA